MLLCKNVFRLSVRLTETVRVSCSFTRSLSLTLPLAGDLVGYEAPKWAKTLNNVPSHKVQLAVPNTPIHRWYLPGIPDGYEVYIKRDDMTGSTLSGNKVRKLEYLLADALQQGCKHVVTCGGSQSNFCRATAVACAQLGLKAHLVLRAGDAKHVDDIVWNGNLLINKMCGAAHYFVPQSENVWTWTQRLAQDIE